MKNDYKSDYQSKVGDILNNSYKQNKQIQDEFLSKSLKTLETFRAYPIVIAIMAALQMLCILYGRHFVDIVFGWHVALGNLFFTPLVIYIFQIVAECYGWQYARQMVWCNFTFNGLVTIFTFVMSYVPYSDFTHTNLRLSYQNFVDTIWLSCLINLIVIFFSDYFSTVAMSKSKIFARGRFLLLRVLIIHCISESILLLGGVIGYLYNNYSLAEIIPMQMHMFVARFIIAIVFSPLISFFIWVIQAKVEKVVAFDTGNNLWDILHWNISNDEIASVDYQEWSKLSALEKKRFDVASIDLEYYKRQLK